MAKAEAQAEIGPIQLNIFSTLNLDRNLGFPMYARSEGGLLTLGRV